MPTYKQITCANCNNTVNRTLSQYNQSLRQGAVNFYCSKDCFVAHKSNKVSISCSVCSVEYKVTLSKSQPKKHYCKDCMGKKVEIICCICSKKVIRYSSTLRNYVTRNSPSKNYCSTKCKNIGSRVPWNQLTRSMLKQRWCSEFGESDLYCRRCGHNKKFNIVIHHKKYITNGGDNNPKNLEPLCLNCHGEEHYQKKDND